MPSWTSAKRFRVSCLFASQPAAGQDDASHLCTARALLEMCSLNDLARLQAKLRELSLLVEEFAADASQSVHGESPPQSSSPPSPPLSSPVSSPPLIASPPPTSPTLVQQQRLAGPGGAQPGGRVSDRPLRPRAAAPSSAAPAHESPRVSNIILRSQNVTVRAKARRAGGTEAGTEDAALWRELDESMSGYRSE
jgi:hypothetical protein